MSAANVDAALGTRYPIDGSHNVAALNRTAHVPCYQTKTRLTLGPSRWDSVWTTYATQGCAKARKARLASALGFDRVVPSGRKNILRQPRPV